MGQSATSGSLRFSVNDLNPEDLPPDSLDDPDVLVETTNRALSLARGSSLMHASGQSAPGFEIPVTKEMEEAICNKWKLILGQFRNLRVYLL